MVTGQGKGIIKELSSQSKHIAAVVVVYQPDKSVFSNIDTYIRQVDRLYIADNSERIDDGIRSELQNLPGTVYTNMGGNKGIGCALNRAAQAAAEKGYTHLLTLDDDGRAAPDMVQRLAAVEASVSKAGQTAALHTSNIETQNIEAGGSVEEITIVLTSGALVNLNAWKEIGGWNEDLFIDYVDHDFSLRLLQHGWKNYLTGDALLDHRLGATEPKRLFGKTVYPTNHSPVRVYYQTRNRLWLKKKYGKEFPAVIKKEMKLMRNTMMKIALFEKEKNRKFKMIRRGIKDFKAGIMGKYAG